MSLSNFATPKGTTREAAEDYGWLIRRTKRVEELLAQPPIMVMADSLAEYIDRMCKVREIDVKELEIDILPTQTKRYITIHMASDECVTCEGVGQFKDGRRCSQCEGTGRQ
jgi:RecJ-like exonuclease